jgi:hypothetical protein
MEEEVVEGGGFEVVNWVVDVGVSEYHRGTSLPFLLSSPTPARTKVVM